MSVILSESEIEEICRVHPQWSLNHGELTSHWRFGDFPAAIEFVNQIAALAESADHHPDIDIRYYQVHLRLISHDAGGITKRDKAMVEAIDRRFAAHRDLR